MKHVYTRDRVDNCVVFTLGIIIVHTMYSM